MTGSHNHMMITDRVWPRTSKLMEQRGSPLACFALLANDGKVVPHMDCSESQLVSEMEQRVRLKWIDVEAERGDNPRCFQPVVSSFRCVQDGREVPQV